MFQFNTQLTTSMVARPFSNCCSSVL